jgi:hypothetical protein
MAKLVLGSVALLAYTYAGYPLLIALLAALRPRRPVPSGAWEPTVTACVPFHDAARFVGAKVESLLAQEYPKEKLEVLLYADGSHDDGAAQAAALAAGPERVRLLSGDARRGKPHALNRMREAASGEVLLMTDIRQPLEPGSLRALVDALADPTVACVSGVLRLEGAAGASAYWRYESWIRRCESRFRGTVGVTGAIYVVRRRDLPPLPDDLLLDDVYIPMLLRLSGRRILLAEAATARDNAFDDDREFGRKVRTLAGNFQLLAKLPRLLSPFANPSWFELVSHKLLRLVCPYALVALLAGAAAGAGRSRGLALLALGQAALYGLAAIGVAGGRVGRLARTFVVLNAAAVVALWRFVRRDQRVTW